MGNWWKIAKLELRLAFKDKESVIWSLAAPIAFAWFFGTMFGSGPTPDTRVAIDHGTNPEYVGAIFKGLLEKKGIVVLEERQATIVLPDSLIHSIIEGGDADIEIIRGGLGDRRVQQLSMRVREILFTLTFAVKKNWLVAAPDSAAIAALVESNGPIYIESRHLGKVPHTASGFEHQLPAMVVMFLLFQLTTYFLVMWVQDVQSGKIKRITMSPTSVRQLFLGQVVSRFLWGCLQVLMIAGVGSLLLGVRLEWPWGYAAIMLAEKANAVGVITALVLAALGGCWWPLEIITSQVMRAVPMFLPTGLMMNAVGDFTAYGKDAAFPTINFLGLLAMTAVFMPLGIRRLRRQIVG